MLLESRSAPGSFAVGDRRRIAIGRSIQLALLSGVLFVVFSVGVKDYRPLTQFAPWAEDPYDAFVSFGMFFVALLLVISAIRLPLCRVDDVLPHARVAGLIRASRVILIAVAATFTAAWVSVLESGSPRLWDVRTAFLVAVLGLETIILVFAVVALVRAGRLTPRPDLDNGRPDWVDDAEGLLDRAVARFSAVPFAAELVRSACGPLLRLSRRRPLSAATLLGLSFGLFVAGGAAVEEDPPSLVLLLGAIGFAGMFAFSVATGSYLGIVVQNGAAIGSSVLRRAAVATVIASASVPVALAFRDSLWWLVGSNATDAAVPQLMWLLAEVGAATFVIAIVFSSIIRKR